MESHLFFVNIYYVSIYIRRVDAYFLLLINNKNLMFGRIMRKILVCIGSWLYLNMFVEEYFITKHAYIFNYFSFFRKKNYGLDRLDVTSKLKIILNSNKF